MMHPINSQKFNILALGPDRRKGGGMATVICNLYGNEMADKFRFIYIPTQVNGTSWEKFRHLLKVIVLFWKVNLTKRIDLIHIHSASRVSYFRKSIFILFSKLFRRKVILHIHGGAFCQFYYDECAAPVRWYVRKTLNMADTVVVLSDQWSKKFAAIVNPERIKVIPNPVQIPPQYSRDAKDVRWKKVLFVGQLVEQKGIYDLIAVAERLIPKYKNIKFILAGGGDVERIQEILGKKGLSEYFEFPGWIRYTEMYYKEADVFVLPSYVEALPMVVLEAASYGLPIVATRVGAIPEIIETEKSGFLFEPGSIDGFAQKLDLLLEDESMRQRIGQAAREKIANYCAKSKVLSQLEQLYFSLLRFSP